MAPTRAASDPQAKRPGHLGTQYDARHRFKALWYAIQFSDLVRVKPRPLMDEQTEGRRLYDQIGDRKPDVAAFLVVGDRRSAV